MSNHEVVRTDGFKVQPVCSTCSHWMPVSQAPECRDGNCSPKGGEVMPAIGHCSKYSQDLQCVELEVGEYFAACYAEGATLTKKSVASLDPD